MTQTGPVKSFAVGVTVLALVASACGSGDEPNVAGPPPVSTSAPSPTAAPTAARDSPGVAASRQPGAPQPAPSQPAPTQPLTWKSCEGGFQCATLKVPLVDADPGRGTVALALTRRRTAEPAQRLGSLVVNPGGPGASAVGFLQRGWEQIPPAVRARFDLVAFDPRGVGRSAPVRCGTTAELDRYFGLDPSPDDAAELAALQRGNEQLVAECVRRSGATLPYVSTSDAARDLDRVREALGDDKLTYLGYSYGTSLGAAYLDRFPTRVRAMVLDGGIDPTLSWDGYLEGQSRGFDRALEAFLADCERIRCSFRQEVSGELGAAYDRLAAQVERAPLPGDGARTVGPGEFSLGVGAGLYSKRSGWPAIAAALTAAQRGVGGPLLALNDSYLERDAKGYANVTEANLAVNCIDRPWPREAAPYLALADRVRRDAPRFGPAIALSGLACAEWPVAPVGEPHAVTAPGAPPVVVIGTTADPATPFAWSVALADQLSSGVLLTHRGDGHTVYRVGAPPCLRVPVDRYLLTGAAPEPLTC